MNDRQNNAKEMAIFIGIVFVSLSFLGYYYRWELLYGLHVYIKGVAFGFSYVLADAATVYEYFDTKGFQRQFDIYRDAWSVLAFPLGLTGGSIMVGLGGWIMLRWDVQHDYNKPLTFERLRKYMIKMFPRVTPVLDRETNLADADEETKDLWRSRKYPLEMALDNDLIVDRDGNPKDHEGFYEGEHRHLTGNPERTVGERLLDVDAAYELFMDQVDRPWPGLENVDEIDGLHRPLIAGFMMQSAGEVEEARNYYHNVAKTYDEDRLVISECRASELIEDYKDEVPVDFYDKLENHRTFYGPAMMAMLDFAKTRGVLFKSYWLWLRPLDTFMYYVLDHVGGRVPNAEAGGVWAHYQAEKRNGETGSTITTPHVDEAIDGLRNFLERYDLITGDYRERG